MARTGAGAVQEHDKAVWDDGPDPATNGSSGEIGHMNNAPSGVAKSGAHRRGPSGGRGEVRERIRSAARREFIARGYDDTTMRAVARRASCDAAMVTYYFGSKQRLFRESFDLPLDPAQEVLSLLEPGLEGAGERLVRYALVLYDERLTSETMQALMRALMTDAATSQRFRTYIRTDILEKVSQYLGGGSAVGEHIEMTMALMYGVITMRYVVRLEPLASMSHDRLVAELAPLVQDRINRVAASTGLGG